MGCQEKKEELSSQGMGVDSRAQSWTLDSLAYKALSLPGVVSTLCLGLAPWTSIVSWIQVRPEALGM